MTYPTVLVTAANVPAARRIADGLLRYGYEAFTATSEQEALAILGAERRLGVLLSDVDAVGLDLARKARALRPTLGIVYASAAPQLISTGAKLPGAPMLRSPYTPHQLASVISGLGKRVLDDPLAA